LRDVPLDLLLDLVLRLGRDGRHLVRILEDLRARLLRPVPDEVLERAAEPRAHSGLVFGATPLEGRLVRDDVRVVLHVADVRLIAP
jgi:hypothetical protein